MFLYIQFHLCNLQPWEHVVISCFLIMFAGSSRGRYLTDTALYLAGVVEEALLIIRGVIFEFWALGFFEHPYFVAS